MLGLLQVAVRAAAKDIGMRAIKLAAGTEQREAALMQQRKTYRQPLTSREDIRAAALAVANGWALPPITGQPVAHLVLLHTPLPTVQQSHL